MAQKIEYFPKFCLTPAKDYEVEIRVQQDDYYKSQPEGTRIKLGTWNIRGGSDKGKRDRISELLEDENITVACLQETHMSKGQYNNEFFTWYLSGGDSSKTHRGVAILIRNKAAEMENFLPINENLAAGSIKTAGTRLKIITCHIPSKMEKASREFENLSNILTVWREGGDQVLIAGDFNSHLGYKEIEEENRLIGKRLKHEVSNENGQLFKNLIILHDLNLLTSWSVSKSVLTTWTNGWTESQLDHILMANQSPGTSVWCKAKWMDEERVISDHKLVMGKLVLKEKQEQHKKRNRTQERRWNIERLKDQEDKSLYQARIQEEIELLHDKDEENEDRTDNWNGLCEIITKVARETLSAPTSPMTPTRRKAIADQKKARFKKNLFPDRYGMDEDLRKKNKCRREAFREHEIKKCDNFFKNISKVHPLNRMKETYKFLKQYKRNMKKKRKYIPMTKWEEEVRREGKMKIINSIKESDGKGMPPFPAEAQIKQIIQRSKKGKAPGVDNINIELLQEGPKELFKEFIRILEEAWNDATIPEAWTRTIQCPIPKILNPKGVDDYRRITLCSTAYKIYAKLLLHAIDELLPPTPQYQGAFLANRSTEDHIFTIRRITEEAWREGRVMYILALDLAKAFSTVDHQALVVILKQKGIPHTLINRIIRACLHEKTAIQWYGQTTSFQDKNVGVKQGCPISPRLFTIVLHEVIETTVEVLGKFDLQEKNHITLPILLAYADDLIIITDNMADLELFIKEFTPNLQSTGMALNISKCEIMIRDPREIENRRKENVIKLGENKIRVVQTMRYLGAFLTSTLRRKESTRVRIEKAIRGARMVVPFLRKHKPPWNVIRNIYNSIITSVALFGMKATATTKTNRRALKNMEKLIVSLFTQQCRQIPSTKITKLLRGRTIWRRVMNQRIKYWAHIRRRSTNNILQVAKRIGPANKKIGRPCFSWNDSLRNDMLQSKIPLADWEEAAKDKEKVKKLASKIYEITDSSDEDSITDLNKN